jgi:hypothetical protein
MVSPDDRLPDLVIRAGDYLIMSVPSYQGTGSRKKAGFYLFGPRRHEQMELAIGELFTEL